MTWLLPLLLLLLLLSLFENLVGDRGWGARGRLISCFLVAGSVVIANKLWHFKILLLKFGIISVPVPTPSILLPFTKSGLNSIHRGTCTINSTRTLNPRKRPQSGAMDWRCNRVSIFACSAASVVRHLATRDTHHPDSLHSGTALYNNKTNTPPHIDA